VLEAATRAVATAIPFGWLAWFGHSGLAMTGRRPIVLVLMAHYLPGYKAGGPVRTIRNLVASLGDEFDFRIVTSDRDYGTCQPYPDVTINGWNHVEQARVFYANAAARRTCRLAATMAKVDPDIVYLNSFFSPRFSIVPLVLRRVGRGAPRAAWIVAPRGECARGAIAIKSFKKRSFVAAARIAGLHRGVIWQASSAHEAADIERELRVPCDSIHVAPNLTAPVERDLPAAAPRREPARLSVCFLARVCAMKNLLFAIETLSRCTSSVDLHVYGPVEDAAYAARCRALVPVDRSTLTVTWHDEVPHERVRSVLGAHDVFFLPTLGENFGHGIFEALAAGVPVLVSDRTPWRDLEAAGVGWALPLDDHGPFIAAIERLATMPPEARLAMRHRAHAYAARVAESEVAIDANRRLFHAALQLASRADVSPPATIA
jgi:glycosyltransferase involved in cell wall biosynthesis